MSPLGGSISSGSGANLGESETKTVRLVIASSTTRITLATPASGKRIVTESLNINFEGTTDNGIEIYFGTGANIGSTAGKEVFDARQAAKGPVFAIKGHVGLVDEVLSARAEVSLAEDIDIILEYRDKT